MPNTFSTPAASHLTELTVRDMSNYLNELPLFTCNNMIDGALDLARIVVDADNYYWLGQPFPSGNDIYFTPGLTFGGSINVPSYSYLVSMTSTCYDTDTGTRSAGFKLRIYDKGAKLDLYNSQFAKDHTVVGPLIADVSNGNAMSQTWMRSPQIVLPPGQWQIEITNLSTHAQSVIQVFFQFACPVTAKNISAVATPK